MKYDHSYIFSFQLDKDCGIIKHIIVTVIIQEKGRYYGII